MPFLDPEIRERYVRALRLALADEHAEPPIYHTNNGDENEYRTDGNLNYIACFSKGLPHNDLGEVLPEAYQQLLNTLASSDRSNFIDIPLGIAPEGAGITTVAQTINELWKNEISKALDFTLIGADPHTVTMSPAPKISSAEVAAEMGELYWMAILRDVPFTEYITNEATNIAADALTDQFSDFRAPKNNNRVTGENLFRSNIPGTLIGPYISQFLLMGTDYPSTGLSVADGWIQWGSSIRTLQKLRVAEPNRDFMGTFDEWLAAQRGLTRSGRERFGKIPRFLGTLRDLSSYVHQTQPVMPFLNAAYILLQMDNGKQQKYSYFSRKSVYEQQASQQLLALVCEGAVSALKAALFQKWFVHRRLRPEQFGGMLHIHKCAKRAYPLCSEILVSDNDSVLAMLYKHNKARFGVASYLLPQAYSEGSPMNPSYGAGYAAVAGACTTVLKAWFEEAFELANCFEPDKEYESLIDNANSLTKPLTVGGELNKLAANISVARSAAGVQWRSDWTEALKLGEEVAISVLTDYLRTCTLPIQFALTKFNGTSIVIEPS